MKPGLTLSRKIILLAIGNFAFIAVGSLAFLIWLFTKRRLPALWLCIALSLLMPLDVLQAVITHGDGDNARRLATQDRPRPRHRAPPQANGRRGRDVFSLW